MYLDRSDLTTQIQNWINDTRNDIALELAKQEYSCSFLYTEATLDTVAGSARYPLPSDYLGHLSLFLGTKQLVRLFPVEHEEITADDSDIQSTDSGSAYLYLTGSNVEDEPDYYIDRGMEIDLYPTPDQVYTLTLVYYAQPTPFSQDNDEDYISRFHFETIIFGAALRGAMFLDDTAKIQEFSQAYGSKLAALIASEKKKATSRQKSRMRTWKDYPLEQFKRIMKFNN